MPRLSRRWRFPGLLAGAVLGTSVGATGSCAGEPAPGLVELQHDGDVVRFQTPSAERPRRYEALASRTHRYNLDHPGDREALAWEGALVAAWAAERHGLPAWRLERRARSLCEAAAPPDDMPLDDATVRAAAAASECLGMLYARSYRWPLGFGDATEAQALLQRALSLDPLDIEANFLYGEFLSRRADASAAVPYLERTLTAPARPGRQVADVALRDEARLLLERLKSP